MAPSNEFQRDPNKPVDPGTPIIRPPTAPPQLLSDEWRKDFAKKMGDQMRGIERDFNLYGKAFLKWLEKETTRDGQVLDAFDFRKTTKTELTEEEISNLVGGAGIRKLVSREQGQVLPLVMRVPVKVHRTKLIEYRRANRNFLWKSARGLGSMTKKSAGEAVSGGLTELFKWLIVLGAVALFAWAKGWMGTKNATAPTPSIAVPTPTTAAAIIVSATPGDQADNRSLMG